MLEGKKLLDPSDLELIRLIHFLHTPSRTPTTHFKDENAHKGGLGFKRYKIGLETNKGRILGDL